MAQTSSSLACVGSCPRLIVWWRLYVWLWIRYYDLISNEFFFFASTRAIVVVPADGRRTEGGPRIRVLCICILLYGEGYSTVIN